MNEMPARRTTLLIALLCVLAIPAIAIAGKGKLVGKDSGRGKSAVAVAQATIRNPGTVRAVITTSPKRKRVQWSYTAVCEKNGRFDRYPGPGDHTTKVSRSKIKRTLKLPLKDAERCDVDIAAKLEYRSGKRVVAKIFHAG